MGTLLGHVTRSVEGLMQPEPGRAGQMERMMGVRGYGDAVGYVPA